MTAYRRIPDIQTLYRDARLALDELQQKQIIGADVFQPHVVVSDNDWDIDYNPRDIAIRTMWQYRIRFYPDNDTDVKIGQAIKLRKKSVITPSQFIDAATTLVRIKTDGTYDEWILYCGVNNGPTRHQIKFFIQAVGSGTITVERIA